MGRCFGNPLPSDFSLGPFGGSAPHEPRLRPHGRPLPRRADVSRGFGDGDAAAVALGGTEGRCLNRALGSPGRRGAGGGPGRQFWLKCSLSHQPCSGCGGAPTSGARFAPVPESRARLLASPGHAQWPFADAAAELGGARRGWTHGSGRARVGLSHLSRSAGRPAATPSPWQPGAGPDAAEGSSRGTWPGPPLTRPVALPPEFRDASPRPLAQLDRFVPGVLDFPKTTSGPLFPDTSRSVFLKARILCR